MRSCSWKEVGEARGEEAGVSLVDLSSMIWSSLLIILLVAVEAMGRKTAASRY